MLKIETIIEDGVEYTKASFKPIVYDSAIATPWRAGRKNWHVAQWYLRLLAAFEARLRFEAAGSAMLTADITEKKAAFAEELMEVIIAKNIRVTGDGTTTETEIKTQSGA